jgi:arylsulfatase A-like enzyme
MLKPVPTTKPLGWGNTPARSFAAVVVGLLVVLAGCSQPADQRPPEADTIVLITLDTLRRDAVGFMSQDPTSATPNLDAFASQSIVFDNAFAPIPFTLPSHMSLFTGLHPDVHTVEKRTSVLAPSIPTLPEILRDGGFQCFGIVSNLWMKGAFGFERGFELYERVRYDLTYSSRINERALSMLDTERKQDKKLFLFLHFIDPHSDFFNVGGNLMPYYAPPEILESVGLETSDGEFCDQADNCATDFLLAANRGDIDLDSEVIDKLKAYYMAGARYLDRDLGILFAELRERGLWDKALIIITADHGEEFDEHGMLLHVQPYTENLSVPLFIKPPHSSTHRRHQEVVNLVDLMPTILELAGAPVPSVIQGQSFLPLVSGATQDTGPTVGRDKLTPSRYAVRTQDLTVIHDLGTAETEVYDRGSDPGETLDLGDGRADVSTELVAFLRTFIEDGQVLASRFESDEDTNASVLSEDEREKLRAIGYVDD